VPGFGLGDTGRLARAERHLKGGVAVGLDGLDLGDAVVGHVEHGHGDGIAIVREDAHHAHLAAQQSEVFAQTHGASPAPECGAPLFTIPTSIGRGDCPIGHKADRSVLLATVYRRQKSPRV
jgi:hypothetical protein